MLHHFVHVLLIHGGGGTCCQPALARARGRRSKLQWQWVTHLLKDWFFGVPLITPNPVSTKGTIDGWLIERLSPPIKRDRGSFGHLHMQQHVGKCIDHGMLDVDG